MLQQALEINCDTIPFRQWDESFAKGNCESYFIHGSFTVWRRNVFCEVTDRNVVCLGLYIIGRVPCNSIFTENATNESSEAFSAFESAFENNRSRNTLLANPQPDTYTHTQTPTHTGLYTHNPTPTHPRTHTDPHLSQCLAEGAA